MGGGGRQCLSGCPQGVQFGILASSLQAGREEAGGACREAEFTFGAGQNYKLSYPSLASSGHVLGLLCSGHLCGPCLPEFTEVGNRGDGCLKISGAGGWISASQNSPTLFQMCQFAPLKGGEPFTEEA